MTFGVKIFWAYQDISNFGTTSAFPQNKPRIVLRTTQRGLDSHPGRAVKADDSRPIGPGFDPPQGISFLP